MHDSPQTVAGVLLVVVALVAVAALSGRRAVGITLLSAFLVVAVGVGVVVGVGQ